MDKEGKYPIIILEETEKFIKALNEGDNKKSFNEKVDSFFENLKYKIKDLEEKEAEITGKELIKYALSQIDCNPSEYNIKNIAVKLKSRLNSDPENADQFKLLWEFLFSIDKDYDINQKFVFSDKEKNRNRNLDEYDLLSFRDDVIYYFCMNIKKNKKIDKDLLTIIVYAYLRIIKNQYSKSFFIFILSLCIFRGNFDFQYFVVLLLKGINEKNESYLCQVINETLKQKGIENKKIDKINYTMKGVKTLKKMFIDLIEEENKNK
jgi:hypothetical protein